MMDHNKNTKRIAKNTLMLYIRMLFSMIVSLYTSRVVLHALGVDDYGIYSVVGGFVSMFSLISGSLSTAVGRFLTVGLGKGDMGQLKKIFSTSVLIHIILAGTVLVLTETLGLWFVNEKMTIPPERMDAANWVFQASVLSFAISLISVPYSASITSHEHMAAFAYISIGEVSFKLLAVLAVAYTSWASDKLILYAILLMAVSIVTQLTYVVYCRKHFEESRTNLIFENKYIKEIGSFAGWNFIGSTAALLKDQGVNILYNLFIGPSLNAARGIASTVNNVVVKFSTNFMCAMDPQITKSYATQDREYSFHLINIGTRFSFYIMMLITFPIIFETDYVLHLWLGEYPEHTVNLVRLVLILSMMDLNSNALITLQFATGKIRNYQLAVGGLILLNFPLSYLCLKAGLAPEYTYVVAIGISFIAMLTRLYFLKRMAGFPVREFFRKVFLNTMSVSAVSLICPYILHHMMEYGISRFLCVSAVCIVISTLAILYVGCSRTERRYITDKIIEIIRKTGKRNK